jgi:hypothetical protein
MGDNLPEEPEACIVNPGNFSSTTSRVLNHRCVIFRGVSPSPPRSLHFPPPSTSSSNNSCH